MNKLIYPDANEALSESLQGKFATFIGKDRFYNNVKQASSNYLTQQMLDECKPDKDHFLIHFTAVGDYEKYGFNKNADSFPKLANEKYYKTFETNAKLYKEHNSSDPSKSIGIIKKAVYNKDMGRIEVAVWADINKAEKEYEKAKRGETLSCSMGMYCPQDRDNISGKLSKNRSEYEPWMKTAACQYIESWDGKPIRKYAFVHNDNFKFFDLSIVAKPAERIAHYLEYKFPDAVEADNAMLKAAAENNCALTSSLMADIEGLKFNADIADDIVQLSPASLPANKKEMLAKLAKAERDFDVMYGRDKSSPLGKFVNFVAPYTFDKRASAKDKAYNEGLASLKGVTPKTLFRELAKRASVLSFEDFMKVFYEGSEFVKDKDEYDAAVKYACVSLIPDIFKNLSDEILGGQGKSVEIVKVDDSGDDNGVVISPANDVCLAEHIFDAGSAAETCLDTSKDPVQSFMDGLEDKLSLEKDKVGNRVVKLTIVINLGEALKGGNVEPKVDVKTASSDVSDKVKRLAVKYAKAYGLYKISALCDIAALKGRKNTVLDEPTLLTAVAQDRQF